MKSKITGEWSTLSDHDGRAIRNVRQKNFVLARDVLDPESEYRLICRIKNKGEEMI